MKQRIGLITLSMLLFFVSCGGDTGGSSYDDLVSSGWSSFASGDYETAFDHFTGAIDLDPTQAAAYAGLGWSLMKLDFIDQASGTLNIGSTMTNPPADLFAGWAFVLNAQKSYANSNAKITETLTMDANWSFTNAPQLNLNMNDLHVLKAGNHFLVGEFSQSLAEVKILNSSFALSAITSDSDKAALAAEIQRLKGLSKRK